jgi:hypothetical protein
MSVFESDSSGPVTISEYLAHSYHNNKVCHVVPGHAEHIRTVTNPLKILEIVENKEYFNTNGSFSARELIPSSASLSFRVVSPYEGQGLPAKFGWFVVSYTYAFAS